MSSRRRCFKSRGNFSATKTEAMVVIPRRISLPHPPSLLLGGNQIKYVKSFKYLGHIISDDCSDDLDIQRELRSLSIRGNTIIRRFGFLSLEVKSSLFRSYCYGMYTCSLWAQYRQVSLDKLKVCYNNIMRKMTGTPPWISARPIFVGNNVRSFFENLRGTAYSMICRLTSSNNSIIRAIMRSDCYVLSPQRARWNQWLYTDNRSYLLLA